MEMGQFLKFRQMFGGMETWASFDTRGWQLSGGPPMIQNLVFRAPLNLIKSFVSDVQIGPKTASKNVFSRFFSSNFVKIIFRKHDNRAGGGVAVVHICDSIGVVVNLVQI